MGGKLTTSGSCFLNIFTYALKQYNTDSYEEIEKLGIDSHGFCARLGHTCGRENSGVGRVGFTTQSTSGSSLGL